MNLKGKTCVTKGACYGISFEESNGRQILSTFLMFDPRVSISEQDAVAIESKIHDSFQEILAPYWNRSIPDEWETVYLPK